MDAEIRKDYDYYHSHFGAFDEIFDCEYNRELSPSAAYMKVKISRAFSPIGLDKAFSDLKESLDELGFRKFRIFDSGSYSILLATTNGQLIKISPVIGEASEISVTGFRGSGTHSSSAILQPIKTFETKKFKVSILPEVSLVPSPNPLLANYGGALCNKLAKEGFYCEDSIDGEMYARNIGFLKNGEPVVIDANSMIHVDDVKESCKVTVDYCLDKFKAYEHDFKWELPDGTWKQHAEFPQILSGELKGVYPRDEIEDARGEIGVDSDKEKILDDVAEGYEEDAAKRLVGLVENAEKLGKSTEAEAIIKGK